MTEESSVQIIGLKESLQSFHPSSEKELEGIFPSLAKQFLYGGYLSVSYNGQEKYRIYIRTIEFYCHHEGQNNNLPKDLIVYHRNGHYVKGVVPYFPLMAIHAHTSGFDITFENEDLELRSSALIRAYEIYDNTNNAFLFYDKVEHLFRGSKGESERINKQSTYLYNFLNGFIGDSVKWVDDVRSQNSELKIASRKNVFLFDKNGNKTKEKDMRPWSFTRIDAIP